MPRSARESKDAHDSIKHESLQHKVSLSNKQIPEFWVPSKAIRRSDDEQKVQQEDFRTREEEIQDQRTGEKKKQDWESWGYYGPKPSRPTPPLQMSTSQSSSSSTGPRPIPDRNDRSMPGASSAADKSRSTSASHRSTTWMPSTRPSSSSQPSSTPKPPTPSAQQNDKVVPGAPSIPVSETGARIEEKVKKKEETKRKEDEIERKEMLVKKKKKEVEKKGAQAKKRAEDLRRQEEEVARRLNEEERRVEQDILRKSQEAKRKEEETRLRQEAERKEEEALRKELEIGRREEEARKKEDEIKRKEDEIKRKEMLLKKKEEEVKRKEVQAKKKAEDLRRQEEEVARRLDEEERRVSLEILRKSQEAKRKEDEVRRKEEDARLKEEAARAKEEEIRRKEEELARWKEELTRREEELARRKEELDSPEDLTNELQERSTYPITSGGFGDIWKCVLAKPSETVQVAVKTIRAFDSDNEVMMRKNAKRVRRELKVWGRLKHHSILPLWGVANDFGPYLAMICPWAHNGALTGFLERQQDILSSQDKFSLLNDIALGLQYLHSKSVVHGDLTGSNVLIYANGRACLADFGLSTIIQEFVGTSYFTSTNRGNIRWVAAELCEAPEDDQVLLSTECDIYSFGSITLQVLTCKVPYYNVRNDIVVLGQVIKGMKPEPPKESQIAPGHWEIIQRCWLPRASRPSVGEIVAFVECERQALSS